MSNYFIEFMATAYVNAMFELEMAPDEDHEAELDDLDMSVDMYDLRASPDDVDVSVFFRDDDGKKIKILSDSAGSEGEAKQMALAAISKHKTRRMKTKKQTNGTGRAA